MRAIAEAIVRAIAQYRWVSLILLLLALCASGAAYGNAIQWDFEKQPVDNGIEIWFLEDDPALKRFHGFHEEFGNDEVVLISLRSEEGIYTPQALNLIAEISSRLVAIPPIEGGPTRASKEDEEPLPPIEAVTSLATVVHAVAEGEEEIVSKRLYTAPVDAEQAARVQREIEGSAFLRGEVVSHDGKTTLITARLHLLEDIDASRQPILDAIEAELRAANKAVGRGERDWSWAGLAVGNEALNAISQRDMVRYTVLSMLVVAICLWFALRRIVPVLIALFAVYAAVNLLLGLYLGLGFKINLVTMILPSLVTVIGLTDSVYFLTTYYQDREPYEAEGLTKQEALVKSFGFCFLPGLFNSITASVGFFAFATAKMAVIRQLGIFAGVGIILAFAMSVVVCTLGCAFFDVRPRQAEDAAGGAWTRGALSWLSGFVERHHGKIVIGSALVFALACVGVSRIQVDSDPLNYFYPDHPVYRDAMTMNEQFGPAGPLEFVVETGEIEGARSTPVLQSLDTLQRRVIEKEAVVGNAVSVANVASRITELWTGEPGIPEGPNAAQGMLELFYNPRNPEDPMRLVTYPEYDKARVTFRVGKMSSAEVEALIDRIEAAGREVMPEGTHLEASGYVPLYVQLMDYLIDGQVSSLTTTFIVIFVIIAILFRSLRYALLSVPPNIIPVAMTLGFMGFAGINLDGATVLIASISLGVAVDDTIHFIFKFRDVYEKTGDDAVAARKTLRTTGVAIATTSLVIALGFSVIALGDLRSMMYFGLLTAVTMVSALLGELLVTPAIILTFGPRRKAEGDADPKPDPTP